MDDRQLESLVGNIYDIVSGDTNWCEFGEKLASFSNAHRVAIHLKHSDGTYANIAQRSHALQSDYTQYYHSIDPFKKAAAQPTLYLSSAVNWSGQFSQDIVPDSEFLKSEYYADYARPNLQRYSITLRFGQDDAAMMALFRGDRGGTFDAENLRDVRYLFPHLKRGLKLHDLLRTKERTAGLGLAALDASPQSIILVDGSLQILFANLVADRLITSGHSALHVTRSGPVGRQGRLRLSAASRHDTAAIEALVVSVAAKHGPGGAVRLQLPFSQGERPRHLSVLVSPVPARLATAAPAGALSGRADGIAMIVARDLGITDVPQPALLTDLFSLSPSETAVGLALLGGNTAEQVAEARDVSIDTVRRQIRMVLSKTGTQNLRDFERIVAMLATMKTESAS